MPQLQESRQKSTNYFSALSSLIVSLYDCFKFGFSNNPAIMRSGSQDETDADYHDWPILNSEKFWIDHQPFLRSRGCELRPRYHPGWVPSWTLRAADEGILYFEDAYTLPWGKRLDATRLSDGRKVVLSALIPGHRSSPPCNYSVRTPIYYHAKTTIYASMVCRATDEFDTPENGLNDTSKAKPSSTQQTFLLPVIIPSDSPMTTKQFLRSSVPITLRPFRLENIRSDLFSN
ncbi:Protein kinase domain-containing protein [Mycena indigotica]|uniref:Protein kinase domain-containing protein n=1 Tax=Mycena indigotica TaxID=2126181 RepID=A0A8H6SXZ3_9AGAR|nr:Protein kinase domain-containing protein [Mycena indigotica]KAF7306387.1 Protein kinase domain-containing protein [Mycena indigotica]